MAKATLPQAQNPLILRCQRLIEAFAKSNDERDFFLDTNEGFLVYVDLDKSELELDELEREIKAHPNRYLAIPKLTFYETKKIMEGFVNEKVYDVDTKEKLIDIIQGKEARDHFLEFIYDHHAEMEKWQQYYQERSRIRVIEWLRQHKMDFVFEEDLDLPRNLLEKIKEEFFEPKASKDVLSARKMLIAKAKTYYSNDALHPRPKRGRPPKQAVKLEIEPQISVDIYTTVPKHVRPFLFTPDVSVSSSGVLFSSKFETEEELLANRRQNTQLGLSLEALNEKLDVLRRIGKPVAEPIEDLSEDFGDDDWGDDDDDEDDEDEPKKRKAAPKKKAAAPAKAKKAPPKPAAKKKR